MGEVIPANATTHLQLRGIGANTRLALIPVIPLLTANERAVECLAPCNVEISPGRYQVVVVRPGTRTGGDTVDIPLAGGTLLVDVDRWRPVGSGLLGGGIAALVVGLLGTFIGVSEAVTHGFNPLAGGAWLPVGIVFDVAGGVMLGVGAWAAQNYRTRLE